jgi:hypothetical protein
MGGGGEQGFLGVLPKKSGWAYEGRVDVGGLPVLPPTHTRARFL